MGKRCWVTCLIDKNVYLIKEDLAMSLIWNKKYYKNYFVKSTSINNQVLCHYCNQDGHMKNRCPVKKNVYYGVKCIWVPKRTIPNI